MMNAARRIGWATYRGRRTYASESRAITSAVPNAAGGEAQKAVDIDAAFLMGWTLLLTATCAFAGAGAWIFEREFEKQAVYIGGVQDDLNYRVNCLEMQIADLSRKVEREISKRGN